MFMLNLLFYMSLCGFALNYYYYLKSLMMIEFIMVSLMLILMVSGMASICDYIIYILILSVCEGIMGLLMVMLIYRIWGTDSFMLIDYNF